MGRDRTIDLPEYPGVNALLSKVDRFWTNTGFPHDMIGVLMSDGIMVSSLKATVKRYDSAWMNSISQQTLLCILNHQVLSESQQRKLRRLIRTSSISQIQSTN
jgi:hypothetical protein